MDHQWCPGALANGQSPDSEKGLTLNEDQAFFIGRTAQSALASRAARIGLRSSCPAWPAGHAGSRAAGSEAYWALILLTMPVVEQLSTKLRIFTEPPLASTSL